MKQKQGQHRCRFSTFWGSVKLQSLLALLALLLLPARMAAQADYDKSVTFTAIAGSNNHFNNEGYGNLFDGRKTWNNFSKWCCSFANPTYVIFEASKPGTPVGYTITTGNDNESETGRNPKSWNLYGNNEGRSGKWTLIQSVTNDNTLQDKNYTPYDFTCEGTGSYKYFKWEITATQGSDVMQVAEFELKLVTCTHKNADGSSALGEALSTTPATCIRHAYSTYKCSICNEEVEVEEEGELAPHQYVEHKESATCLRRAYTWKQCSVCNEKVEGEEEGELAPHTLVWHEAKAATCWDDGNKEYWKCSVCYKLFGDEAATVVITSESDTKILATGHSFNSEGTCTACGYTDTLYPLIAMDGITFKEIDNDNSWVALDPSAAELKDLGIPEGSRGLMSTTAWQTSEVNGGYTTFLMRLKADKPFVLSFDYGLTPSTGSITVSDGNTTRVYDVTKNKAKIILGAGEHDIYVEYVKYVMSKDVASRAVIYNLKAEYSYTGATAIYDESSRTMTFKSVDDESISDNMFAVNEGQEPRFSYEDVRIDHVVIDESFKSYSPTSLCNFFRDLGSLTEIEGLENINTAQVSDMSDMFCFCRTLKNLDLSSFNVANVKYMTGMFYGCKRLERLIVPDVDKDNLYDYSRILTDCPATVYCSVKEAAKGSSSVFAANTMSPYVSITSNAEYGTLCVPVGGTLAEGGFSGFDKLYTVDTYETERNVVKLKEATGIEPGVPYIYRRKQADTDPVAGAITFTADVTATATAPVNDGMLKGTFERTTAPVGSYVLQTDGMFHPVARAGAIAVAPYRAYLEIPGYDPDGGYAKAFQLEFGDGETTGLDGIADNAPADAPADAPVDYYDLMGRRVDAPQKGRIYITRGKKVLFE